MSDLISRQAAIDAIKALWNDAPSAQHVSAMFDCEDAIRALPSAELVRHGKWMFTPSDAIEAMFTKPKCSECGFESADGGNYCPNCGARMDK